MKRDQQRTLRIVHVEAGMHLYGGAKQVAYLLDGLAARGHENHLVCPPGAAIAGAAREAGAQVHAIGPRSDLDVGFRWRLARLLRALRPDILHLHSRRGADWWGARAGRATGVPVVLSRRVDNPEPRWLARLRYVPVDRVIAISEGIARVLESLGLDSGRLRVVRSAVDAAPWQQPESRQALCARFGLDPARPVAGVIAQLIPRKGHAVLIAAMERLGPDCPLQVLCLGKGPLRPELERMVEQRGLSGRIVFGGFVDDLPRWMGALDLVIHPALMEGLGVALLQAAAAGVPVIGARAGGIPEAVADGQTGLLVEPGDDAALAEAIAALLADPERRRAMGEAGRHRIAEQFSIPAMVEGNLAVYRELVEAR